jgi:hypothetical protein
MRASVEMGLKSLRGRMQGFLQVGLLDDELLYARALRGLRTQVTRVILELEKGDGLAKVDAGSGVVAGGAGVDPGAAGADAAVAAVRPSDDGLAAEEAEAVVRPVRGAGL